MGNQHSRRAGLLQDVKNLIPHAVPQTGHPSPNRAHQGGRPAAREPRPGRALPAAALHRRVHGDTHPRIGPCRPGQETSSRVCAGPPGAPRPSQRQHSRERSGAEKGVVLENEPDLALLGRQDTLIVGDHLAINPDASRIGRFQAPRQASIQSSYRNQTAQQANHLPRFDFEADIGNSRSTVIGVADLVKHKRFRSSAICHQAILRLSPPFGPDNEAMSDPQGINFGQAVRGGHRTLLSFSLETHGSACLAKIILSDRNTPPAAVCSVLITRPGNIFPSFP